MLLIHCPNCEHDNTPGERFCAACGVPLDLKPCPQCGKVDRLTAKVCTSCGAAFPPIVVAHLDDGAALPEDRPKPVQDAVPSQPLPPPGNRALPLILIAIAAGGIPLLWMNRAYIPLPKTWQVKAPTAAGSAAAPLTVPKPNPQPTSSATAPVLAPAAAGTARPADGANSSVASAPAVPVAEAVASQPARKEPPKHRSQRMVHPTAGQSGTAAAKTRAARPCTEALAALNLCDPKADQK